MITELQRVSRSAAGGVARTIRMSVRAMTLISAVAFAFFGVACSDATAPAHGPPYLAIVTTLSAYPGVTSPPRISYHITELSGTLGVDKTLSVPPSDTVIISVKPATYVIEVDSVPASCFINEGKGRSIVISDFDNTGIVRYQIQCRGVLSIETATDGYAADDHFIYSLQQEGGGDQVGRIGANDTLVFNDVTPGIYTMQLGGIAPNCVVTSEGGDRQTVTVDQTGGVRIGFRVQCAQESARPVILSMRSSYVLGSSVFIMKVYDPNHDIDGYTWNLTDCHQNSVLLDKHGQTRRGVMAGRGRLQDTATIVGAYEVGLPSEAMQGRCTEIRVFDDAGNSSPVVEHRIGSATGHAPQPTSFNAKLIGTEYVQTTLGVTDPDGDLGGLFVAARLRDGTLGVSDGNPDLGIMDPAGYISIQVPNLLTNGRIHWDDVYAIIVWVIDEEGNAIRLEDADVFH